MVERKGGERNSRGRRASHCVASSSLFPRPLPPSLPLPLLLRQRRKTGRRGTLAAVGKRERSVVLVLSISLCKHTSTLIHFLNMYLLVVNDHRCGLFLASSAQVSLFEANFILRGVVNNLDRQNGGVSGGDSRNGHHADCSIPDRRSISFSPPFPPATPKSSTATSTYF